LKGLKVPTKSGGHINTECNRIRYLCNQIGAFHTVTTMAAEKTKREKRGRSYNMSRIRSKDTRPEMAVRRWLYAHGYRYRKNDRRLPGTPDIVMRKYSVCIFVHGCFWHAHYHIVYPRTNAEFWRKKLERNKKRDAECKAQLLNMGWNVITVWECQLKPAVFERTMREVEHWINHSLLIKMGAKFHHQVAAESHDGTSAMAYASPPEDDMDLAAEPLPPYKDTDEQDTTPSPNTIH
jgi:DNA mismatch endonuclease (patch repair protein)